MKNLTLILGGRESIEEFYNPWMESLEIVRVRGLAELGDISRFINLRSLHIEGQIKIEEVEFKNGLESLIDLKILNCKELKKVDKFLLLPNLLQLRISKTKINPDSFLKQSLPKSLEIVAFYTSRVKQDKLIRKELDKLGYSEFS